MPRSSIADLADALREQYMKASKSEKGTILAEFCRATGYHRKSAVRLLRCDPLASVERRGRPRSYGSDVIIALEVAWKAADHACSKRLAPFLAELVPILERHGAIHCSDSVREQLVSLSSSTIDRLLKPVRFYHVKHPTSHVHSPTVIRAQVPIRTFGEWSHAPVGSMQMDMVFHCGRSTAGFFLTSLVAVDVATGWTECIAVWGHGYSRVGGAVDRIRRTLPFPMVALHSDNGAEMLNSSVYDYCQRHRVTYSRGRPYKKNDQAYVEQKNWQVVRRLIGYDRLVTKEAYDTMQQLYVLVRLYVNFFQPISKVVSKERTGARVRKHYDVARTPYQRLLETGVLDPEMHRTLQALYARLDPLRLLEDIEELNERLKRLSVLDPETKRMLAAKEKLLEEALERERIAAG